MYRATTLRRPQSNGFIERLLWTLLDEHFLIREGGTTRCESVEQMQTALDSILQHYNTQRRHQGRLMEGKTSTACSRRV
ncbi:transposase [Aeromonas rivipollensis]|uniref:Transposase n=1 Tax=Aeromonas rivipollensis TaxID=948519 RepID=A0AAW9Y7B2_9GAMM|nr:transposase [Aeromonas rivipollensis]